MKNRNKQYVICLLTLTSLLFLSCVMLTVQAIDTSKPTGTLYGHTTAWTGTYNLSWEKGSVTYESVAREDFVAPNTGIVLSVWAYLRYSFSAQKVTCGIYDPANAFIFRTEEKTISSNVFRWHQFNFTTACPVINQSSIYALVCFGDAVNSLNTRRYIQIGSLNLTGVIRRRVLATYPTFPTSPIWTTDILKDFSIYGTYQIIPSNSTALATYENIVNTKGTHQTQYSSATGWKVWANYTTTMMLRQNLNSYLSGTHQSRWNSTTGNMMVWANYSGAGFMFTVPKHNGNFSANATYSVGINRWTAQLNISDNIDTVENIVNATGTHEDKEILSHYSAGSYFIRHFSNWSVWANYTGNLTPINSFQNIVNATGSHTIIQNSTGYWDWANYTGNLTALHLDENIVNATGTHDYSQNDTGYWVWANYTGDTTPVTLFQNPLYAFGTHTKTLRGSGGWDVFANYTSAIGESENIVNATGTHEHRWNASTSTWWDWANYTGNLTPYHKFTNIINATGTHTSKQNSTGYWDWANYTGNASGGNISSFHMFLNLSGVIGFINWTGDLNSNLTNMSFNVSSNMSIQGNANANNSDSFLYYASFDVSQSFLLISIFFGLVYFWWKSERLSMMYMLAMLIVPYDFVVVVVYALPLYITDVDILAFVRIIFIIISLVVMGFTIDSWDKSRKAKKEAQAS